MQRRLLPFALCVTACARTQPVPAQGVGGPSALQIVLHADPLESGGGDGDVALEPPALPAVDRGPPIVQLDPDGNDDPEEPGAGTLPTEGRFERVGRPPLALQRICDLTPFGGALYAAHANQPLGTDGATITRYVPPSADAPDAGMKRASPFSVAFDWNRPGEPAGGGGAGQGFLRVRAIEGRLYVPDADPPYNGFGISEGGTEGFVFVSDGRGKLARAVGDHFRPPQPPTLDGGGGAMVLPRAYHVLDVIRFRGRLYASTGSVPPGEHAWRGPSPGALHVASSSSRMTYEVGYPFPYKEGVWRLGFMVRFKDRLYAGIQDYDGREPNDYVVFAPPPDSERITQGDIRPARVTEGGGALTLRWYTDRGKLYWITLEKSGAGVLRVTSDGDRWEVVPLPDAAGRPTDVVRFRDGLVVLAEHGLVRLDTEAKGAEIVARVEGKVSPFEITDAFCAAPLAVLEGELYAGGQRDGALFRLVASAARGL
jgi:hypothetical protein